MSELCAGLAALSSDLSPSWTATHCPYIKFFLDGRNRIYAVDAGAEARLRRRLPDVDVVRVARVDTRTAGTSPAIEIRRYRTSHALPYVLLFAEVVHEQRLRISLADYAQTETNRIRRLVDQCTEELETVFGSLLERS
jgi:hypothetical protein